MQAYTFIGSVHLLCTTYLSGGCSLRPVYYSDSVHLLCSAYLLGGCSPHPDLLLRGYLLHMRYHVLRCGSREYPTFHYSLAHPLFLVARVCRCAAARYGCACTVAVLDNRSGTALSLGCGVDASGRRFGFARSGGRLGRLLGVLCTAGCAAIGGGCRGCGLWRFTPGCPTAGWAPRPRL